MRRFIMKKLLAASLLACTFSVTGCWGCLEQEQPNNEDFLIDTSLETQTLTADEVPVVEEEDRRQWAHQVNKLGQKLLNQRQKDKNFVISPASLHSALTMAAYGADDNTYTEFATALSLDADREKAAKLSADMALNLRFDGQNENSTLVMASNLWLDEHIEIHESFKDAMKDMFKAPVQVCNFIDYTFWIMDTINDWLYDITKGFVSMWASQSPDKDVNFMLVNATNFIGKWAYPFDSSKTESKLFDGVSKDTVVDFMQLIYDFSYYENAEKGYQAVIIPYMDGIFDMVIVLPNDAETAQDVLQNVTAEDFGTIMLEAADTKLIELSLPKFKVSYDVEPSELIDSLKNIGIQEAFEEGMANFDILSPSYNVFIDSILHQAVIAIDENGTNVSDAPTVTPDVTDSDKEMLGFNVDHAFAFAIVHRSSGAVVYLGMMNEL